MEDLKVRMGSQEKEYFKFTYIEYYVPLTNSGHYLQKEGPPTIFRLITVRDSTFILKCEGIW